MAGLARSPAWRRWERWWLDHTVAPEALRLFRLLFFAVVAVDSWLEVAHAPRYGAGDFNVSHLPWLDGIIPVPGRPLVAFAFLAQAYLAALIALGAGGRLAIGALAALFAATYFPSQLDSYQHHYLLFLVLLLCCFVPWEGAGRGDREPVRGWPVRLVLVQISIVYLFAAVSKMDPRWWSGDVLALQVHGWARDAVERLGGFGRAAPLVVLVELLLAVAIHVRALRGPAAILGIVFHAGIEAAGFRIGLFSYFMLALYVLVIPERPLAWLVRRVDGWRAPLVDRWRARRLALPPAGRAGLAGAAILAGSAALLTVPLGPPAVAAALVCGGAGAALVVRRRGQAGSIALGHLAACLLVAILARPSVTDTAREYYQFWGGSSRRLGDLETATRAYQRVVAIDPGYAQGHTSLANLYRRRGEVDRALAEAAIAQRLAPQDHRPHLVEALIRDGAGQGPEALAAAERALERKPGDRQAAQIAARWRARLPAQGGEE